MELPEKPTKILGTRHWQMLLLFITNLFATAIRSMMSVAVVAMTDNKSKNPDIPTFDWDGNQKSLLFGSVLWGCAIAQIPFGFAIMRFDVQKLVTIGMLSSGAICLIIPTLAIKTGWLPTFICAILIGFGVSTTDPCIQNLVSRWTPRTERSRFSTFVTSGLNMGIIFSMFMGGQIAATSIGWPGIFYMYGFVTILWIILFYFLSSNAPSEHPRISPEERRYIESTQGNLSNIGEKKNLKFPWKSIVKSVPVWAYLICKCSQVGNYYVLSSQLPNFMKNALNFDLDEAGGLSALPYLVKWLLSFPISWLSDVALKGGVKVEVIRKVANTIGMWGPAAMLLLLCLINTSDRTVMVAIMTLSIGLSAGAMSGVVINTLDLSPNFSGTLYSIGESMGKWYGITGPIIANAIVTDTKNVNQWYTLFYVTIATYFTTNLIFIIFGKAEEQPWNDPKNSDDNRATLTIEKMPCTIRNEARKVSGPCTYAPRDSTTTRISHR